MQNHLTQLLTLITMEVPTSLAADHVRNEKVLRTGKRLARHLTQIAVTFRRAPVALFPAARDRGIPPNVLAITIQPDEGFDLNFQVKRPGLPVALAGQRLAFRYAQAFGPLPGAYETLLLDVLADEAEMAWCVYAPVLDDRRRLSFYPAGSWGPPEADRLLVSSGEGWMPR